MPLPRDTQPARVRPPARAGWAYGVVQLMSAIGVLVALFALLDWRPALLIASGVTFAGAVAMEIIGTSRRAPSSAAPIRPGGE